MSSTFRILVLVAFVVGTESAIRCYDCWYQTTADKLLGDDDCNTKRGLEKVDSELCDGKCYTTGYTPGPGLGYWIKRGCEEDKCDAGPYDIVNVGKGNRTCCDTDACNDEILDVSGATWTTPSAIVTLFASAFLVLRRYL